MRQIEGVRAVQEASKPLVLWDASQNGLLALAPQRQNANAAATVDFFAVGADDGDVALHEERAVRAKRDGRLGGRAGGFRERSCQDPKPPRRSTSQPRVTGRPVEFVHVVPKVCPMTQFAQARAQLAGLPGAGESFPFGPGAAVFKVGGKVFAIVDDVGQRISLKGDPDDNVALRQMYPGVIPGYHLNKKHWNTVTVADVPFDEVAAMIDASYDLVVSSLSKAARTALANSDGER